MQPGWEADLPPTLAVEDAARLLGVSRTTAYIEAARYRRSDGAQGLPNFRLGHRVLVPTARLVEIMNGRGAQEGAR